MDSVANPIFFLMIRIVGENMVEGGHRGGDGQK
jgi:hypothetical protein